MLLAVAGIGNPMIATWMGVALIVGRIIYGIGYIVSPALRLPGAIIIDVALIGLVGLAGYSAWGIVAKKKWF